TRVQVHQRGGPVVQDGHGIAHELASPDQFDGARQLMKSVRMAFVALRQGHGFDDGFRVFRRQSMGEQRLDGHLAQGVQGQADPGVRARAVPPGGILASEWIHVLNSSSFRADWPVSTHAPSCLCTVVWMTMMRLAGFLSTTLTSIVKVSPIWTGPLKRRSCPTYTKPAPVRRVCAVEISAPVNKPWTTRRPKTVCAAKASSMCNG